MSKVVNPKHLAELIPVIMTHVPQHDFNWVTESYRNKAPVKVRVFNDDEEIGSDIIDKMVCAGGRSTLDHLTSIIEHCLKAGSADYVAEIILEKYSEVIDMSILLDNVPVGRISGESDLDVTPSSWDPWEYHVGVGSIDDLFPFDGELNAYVAVIDDDDSVEYVKVKEPLSDKALEDTMGNINTSRLIPITAIIAIVYNESTDRFDTVNTLYTIKKGE